MRIGSVVQLKSGGPLMTIVGSGRSSGWSTVLTWICQWFEVDVLKERSFPAAALEEVGRP